MLISDKYRINKWYSIWIFKIQGIECIGAVWCYRWSNNCQPEIYLDFSFVLYICSILIPKNPKIAIKCYLYTTKSQTFSKRPYFWPCYKLHHWFFPTIMIQEPLGKLLILRNGAKQLGYRVKRHELPKKSIIDYSVNLLSVKYSCHYKSCEIYLYQMEGVLNKKDISASIIWTYFRIRYNRFIFIEIFAPGNPLIT